MKSEKPYKKKYIILSKGVREIISLMEKDIYAGRVSPSALKHMSDLKYYLLCAENQHVYRQGERVSLVKVSARKK